MDLKFTVTRLRWAYTPDVYGDPQRTGIPASSPVPGCAVAPRSSNDVTEPARQGVKVGLTLYAPIDADFDAVTDQVEYSGDVYDIDGDIGYWRYPFPGSSLVDGIEIALTRAVG